MWRRTLLIVALLAAFTQAGQSGNWPGWRGPTGDGISPETNLPTQWSATNNIAWKVAVPGEGHSSPILWGERLFLTTALRPTEERCLLCYDRATGKLLWQQTVLRAPLEGKNSENSFASSTGALDGEKVYVTFLDGKEVVVAAYDFSGKPAWQARPGQFYSQHGFSHNPTLFEDKVIVVCESKGENFIAAVSRQDGHTLWKVKCDKPSQSYSPPLIRELAGRMQMIVPGNESVLSLDPRTGKNLWVVNGQSSDAVITPVFNQNAGLLLTSSSWPKRVLLAINPDGNGDVTASKVVWSTAEGAPYVPSPISVDDWFYTSSFASREAFCYEARTGKILWHEKMGLHHASPVAAQGMVYFLNDDGVAHVLKVGPKYELVARNELGEKTYASPAISDGQIFLRGFQNLYAIGPKTAKGK